jgi:hypothetical protein
MSSDLNQKLDALRIDRDAEPEPSGRGRKLAVGAVVALLAGGAAWMLGRDRAVPVRTTTVEQRTGSAAGGASVLNASGYVTARRQATVSS